MSVRNGGHLFAPNLYAWGKGGAVRQTSKSSALRKHGRARSRKGRT